MALLSQDYIDRVNEASDIVAVIGEHVQLRKTGFEYSGLCPFHKEKSPSFSVNPNKNMFVCRGCGKGGNVPQFVVEVTGANFRDVVLDLATRAGIPHPAPPSREDSQAEREIAKLHEILKRASSIYQKALKDSPMAQKYLASRGVTPEMIERFGIGYAPKGGKLLRAAMRDVDESLLMKAGLLYKSEKFEGEVMEWMNNRIVFPIQSKSGKTIAFGGRSMVPDAKRKYLNTPETILFKKGNEFYGLHECGNDIRKANHLAVVEGYVDVVVPYGHDVRLNVSPMGTGLSLASVERLFRAADNVTFCFDGDAAGMRAAVKAMTLATEVIKDGQKANFAFLPGGMDPDEYVLAHGAKAYTAFLEQGMPMSKFLVQEFSSRNDMASAEGRAKFASEAMSLIERMRAPFLKAIMIQEVQAVVGPSVPLPGVTPGVPAVTPAPAPAPEPKRSGFRAFRERVAAPSPSSETPTTEPAMSLPSPAPGNTTDAAAPAPASAPAPAPAAAASPAPAVGFRSRRTMVAAARTSEVDTSPSQAMRMLAFVLRDPQIGSFVGPEQVKYMDGSKEELEVLDQVAEFAFAPEGQQPPTQEAVLAHFKSTSHATLIQAATKLPEFIAEDMDVTAEFQGIMLRCTEKARRAHRRKQFV